MLLSTFNYSPEDPNVSSETRLESYSGDGNHIIGKALGLQGTRAKCLQSFRLPCNPMRAANGCTTTGL